MRIKFFYFFFLVFLGSISAQEIALLQYGGGGDWYANPTALPNLVKFCNQNINTALKEKPQTVTPGSVDIFDYPFVHMTGHGNVYFSAEEAENLRNYLMSGGFLYIDDNYGMNTYIRKELIKIFPNKELKELPANYPMFNYVYNFPQGMPKIHEHDGGRPQAFGIFVEDRLVLLYTFETDLGDGWENPEVHNDPQEVRLKALQMGANIIKYIFEN
ncbi:MULTISPECIES: DUF4159 domain-containing protein [Aequorivita]|uniref:DUF4159 domain-containing protein n=1 Tax=Aequorivita iocasae TaxID=2803865 RepID=A0ABX7DQE8_9FLAO|nr:MULTISPECIES: DUF4159 domain-containing protein [Aequorivita]PHR11952.1 MAG: hypothetical protein COA40_09345 [Aequorivita sp.]QQX76233.1 DUF4159 domain-containing protein [Aequorivita iocasae]UCA55695.1 DUF4159 domain-containing protein [Aequorivita sp. F7]